MKTNVYIDGFNLYYGCLKGTPHKWLDLAAFCQASFPPPRNHINRIRYFTAHVTARPNDPQRRAAANLSSSLADHSAPDDPPRQLPGKATRMPLHPPPATGPKTVQVMKSEEKGSDVNIATYLLVDAFDDDYEAAVVVSNDSDLAEPIRLVRQKFRKKVVILHPCRPGRSRSFELRKVATKSLNVDASLLGACQFSPTLTDANGTIHKPAKW